MGTEFTDFYDHVAKTLLADAAVKVVVTEPDNIRPINDPTQPKEGAAIHYGWTSGSFNDAQRKGIGTFSVVASSLENTTKATELLELVRTALTAKKLTAADDKIRVSKFVQNDALSDDVKTDTGRFQASVTYDVRFVPAA